LCGMVHVGVSMCVFTHMYVSVCVSVYVCVCVYRVSLCILPGFKCSPYMSDELADCCYQLKLALSNLLCCALLCQLLLYPATDVPSCYCTQLLLFPATSVSSYCCAQLMLLPATAVPSYCCAQLLLCAASAAPSYFSCY